MSTPTPSYFSKKFGSKLRLQSKKFEYHNKFEVSSPVSLKLTKSSDDLHSKCHSPILERKKCLTELINTLSSAKNSLEKIKLAFKALKICSEEEGVYSKEMKMIVEVIKHALFVPKDQIESEVLDCIYEKHVDAVIENGPLTYMHIADGFRAVLERHKSDSSAVKTQMSQEVADKKEEVIKNKIEIAKLQAKIDVCIIEPLKKKEADFKSLEEKYTKNLKSLEELRNTITEKDEVIKKFKSQSSIHSKIIYDFQCLEEEYKIRVKDILEELSQANKEIKRLKDDNYKKKHSLELVMFKMKSMICREKELETRIKTLEEQNDDLSRKAGIGFEGLTPRPSFTGIDNLMQEVPERTYKKVEKIIELALLLNATCRNGSPYRRKLQRMGTRNTFKPVNDGDAEENDKSRVL